jgi:hypothetical protein
MNEDGKKTTANDQFKPLPPRGLQGPIAMSPLGTMHRVDPVFAERAAKHNALLETRKAALDAKTQPRRYENKVIRNEFERRR